MASMSSNRFKKAAESLREELKPEATDVSSKEIPVKDEPMVPHTEAKVKSDGASILGRYAEISKGKENRNKRMQVLLTESNMEFLEEMVREGRASSKNDLINFVLELCQQEYRRDS